MKDKNRSVLHFDCKINIKMINCKINTANITF